MQTRSIIKKLNKVIVEKESQDEINNITDLIVEKITEAANEPLFYSLPFEQISNIIKKVEFSNEDKVKEPFILLQTLIQRTSEVHEKEAVLLLNAIKVDKLPHLTLDDTIDIVSKFTKCEILTKLGKLNTEEKSLLEPDYEI